MHSRSPVDAAGAPFFSGPVQRAKDNPIAKGSRDVEERAHDRGAGRLRRGRRRRARIANARASAARSRRASARQSRQRRSRPPCADEPCCRAPREEVPAPLPRRCCRLSSRRSSRESAPPAEPATAATPDAGRHFDPRKLDADRARSEAARQPEPIRNRDSRDRAAPTRRAAMRDAWRVRPGARCCIGAECASTDCQPRAAAASRPIESDACVLRPPAASRAAVRSTAPAARRLSPPIGEHRFAEPASARASRPPAARCIQPMPPPAARATRTPAAAAAGDPADRAAAPAPDAGASPRPSCARGHVRVALALLRSRRLRLARARRRGARPRRPLPLGRSAGLDPDAGPAPRRHAHHASAGCRSSASRPICSSP